MSYVLAQVNIGRLRAPVDSPALADFVAALDPVNAAADAAPGFVWRLQTEDGNATAIKAFSWDAAGSAGVIINMSVWESVEALASFVYSAEHRSVLSRHREWFEQMRDAYTALWWIPRGTVPTVAEADGQGQVPSGARPDARSVLAPYALPAARRAGLSADARQGRMDVPSLDR